MVKTMSAAVAFNPIPLLNDLVEDNDKTSILEKCRAAAKENDISLNDVFNRMVSMAEFAAYTVLYVTAIPALQAELAPA